MPIRAVKGSDYEKLASLYSSFFKIHSIFQQSAQKIILYLKEQAKADTIMVYEDNGKIGGSLLLVKLGENNDKTHIRWKFRHFAFENEQIARELLKEAEKRIQKSSKTAKVELTIAETEKMIDFYKKNGYKQEGILENHYRYGEKCYILGKSFS